MTLDNLEDNLEEFTCVHSLHSKHFRVKIGPSAKKVHPPQFLRCKKSKKCFQPAENLTETLVTKAKKPLQSLHSPLLTSPPPTPPSLKSETPHTHSLFASHEITFFFSSHMYKEVMFTLLHFCRKANANYLVTRNQIGKIRHECTIRRCVTYQCVDLQSIRLAPVVESRFIVARLISVNQRPRFKMFPKNIP